MNDSLRTRRTQRKCGVGGRGDGNGIIEGALLRSEQQANRNHFLFFKDENVNNDQRIYLLMMMTEMIMIACLIFDSLFQRLRSIFKYHGHEKHI